MSNSRNSSFPPSASNGSASQWSQHRFKLSDASSYHNLSPVQTQHTPIAGPSASRPPAPGIDASTNHVTALPAKKAKKRTVEEEEITRETAARFASTLAVDQFLATFPDVDTPFTDPVDVVQRLLPYHIFQQPKEDLDAITKQDDKGKGKATENDLAQEIAETKFALQCQKRKANLEKRFRNARLNSGKRPVPSGQAYILAQMVLEADRTETAALSNELRTARTELDRVEREKRLAAAPPRAPYYTHLSAPQTQYYPRYPYAYAQPYSPSAQPYNASAQPYSPSAQSATPAAHPHANYSVPSTPASTSTSPSVASTPQMNHYSPLPQGEPVNVELPIASLPALQALGIEPVAAASLPPAGQPQPAAVLRGSTANGTMLNLEFTPSLLQQGQKNGLGLILNSLMSRGVAHNGTGTNGAASQNASQPS
ncbi:hypothetical protein PLICRDRAFT_172660 [Plicaturopsis crispa FD-325 SS-3]|nr:hypothetical protein PLICRDRAFT_172660 [Plicaturopsis crispa FD-325 SS-3]